MGMQVQRLSDRLAAAVGADRAESFLGDLVAAECARRAGRGPDWVAALTSAVDLEQEPPGEALAWLAGLRAQLLRRHPEADALALQWVCDRGGRRRAKAEGFARRYPADAALDADPLALLVAWAFHHPAPDQIDPLVQAVRERLALFTPQQHGEERYLTQRLLRLVLRLDAARPADPLSRCRALLTEAVREGREAAANVLAQHLAGTLLENGMLTEPETVALLLTCPDVAKQPWSSGPARSLMGGAMQQLVGRAAAGDGDMRVARAVLSFRAYTGMEVFLSACGELERRAGMKVPTAATLDPAQPLGWTVHVLRNMQPPSATDAARATELSAFKAETLLTAALLAAAWADLIDPYLQWPGLGAVTRWLCENSGTPDEDEETVTPMDRDGALRAAALMGDQRLDELLAHPVARGAYRNGIFYLKAILGRNAADVAASFRNRHLPAVRAIGMLPDQGDILQRYMALRRFAGESRRFKEAEYRAVQCGLVNLAATAGYRDVTQLEWALEPVLAAEAELGRVWTVGAYVVRICPSERADLAVERRGKPVRSVPAAVRQAPEYGAIKAAQEQYRSHWARVGRRLEAAMAAGEIIPRDAFLGMLQTPAGQHQIPHLVLRVWSSPDGRPVEVLDGRTLQGRPVDLRAQHQFQVAHPLQLQATGTLAEWQRRLVAQGITQPFNQLYRELYAAGSAAGQRLAGRQVRSEPLADRLRQLGWRRRALQCLAKPVPGDGTITLSCVQGSLFGRGGEVATLGELHLPPSVNPVAASEALREVEQACLAASPDRAPVAVPPETVVARGALARMLVPGITLEGEEGRIGAYRIHLGTGAVAGPEGAVLLPVRLSAPPRFPYPSPDEETAMIIARLLHVAHQRAGGTR